MVTGFLIATGTGMLANCITDGAKKILNKKNENIQNEENEKKNRLNLLNN